MSQSPPSESITSYRLHLRLGRVRSPLRRSRLPRRLPIRRRRQQPVGYLGPCGPSRVGRLARPDPQPLAALLAQSQCARLSAKRVCAVTSEPLTDKWPYYYKELGSVEHLHALGVIAATYNVLEFQLAHWFRASIGADYKSEVANSLFAALSNNTRLDVVRKHFSQEKFPKYYHLIKCALDSYDICAENRNYLMHSVGNENFVDGEIYNFIKPARNDPGRMVDYPLKVKDLREIADSIRSTASYLECVLSFALSDSPLLRDQSGIEVELSTSIGTIPLPRKLSLICREALQDAQLLHQPWDASQDDPDRLD